MKLSGTLHSFMGKIDCELDNSNSIELSGVDLIEMMRLPNRFSIF